jgi:hypothetical protein
MKSSSSMSGVWSTRWHFISSESLGQPYSSGLICSSHDLILGLSLLIACSFPWQTSMTDMEWLASLISFNCYSFFGFTLTTSFTILVHIAWPPRLFCEIWVENTWFHNSSILHAWKTSIIILESAISSRSIQDSLDHSGSSVWMPARTYTNGIYFHF